MCVPVFDLHAQTHSGNSPALTQRFACSCLHSHIMKELIATERIYVDELLSVLLVRIFRSHAHMVHGNNNH